MLVSRTTNMLRAMPARATTLQQPALRGMATTCLLAAKPTASPTMAIRCQPKILQTLASARSPILGSRSASTTTTSPPSSKAAATDIAEKPLDWNTFFRLRTLRRRWQLAFSGLMCAGSAGGGAIFLGSGSLDSLVSQLPLDPFFTLGLMTFGFAALGWLVGPILGSAAFNVLHRSTKRQMTLKENQFFARVKKNRAEPYGSASNPVPDFYGEKIQSVAGYRQWMKDQRAFNKKRVTFI
ncbi:hypothetical protein MCOR12_000175 [Pyricularia oryzae]|nr:hypothetical protein MCOR12_000175 [Pyricularia oryzae]